MIKVLQYIAITLCLFTSCKQTKNNTINSNSINTVYAQAETDPVSANIDDDSADDPCILINKEKPEKSLIIGTNKKTGFNVYTLDGKQIQHYPVGRLNNIDIRQNIIVDGKMVNIIGASNRSNNSVLIYSIDSEGNAENIAEDTIFSNLSEVYGFCLYQNIETKKLYAFVNDKLGNIEQILLTLNNGKVKGSLVRTLHLSSQVEGMVADDELGKIYVGEEEHCIWRFDATEHGDTTAHQLKGSTIANANIEYDIEGLSLYKQKDGKGFLIASIQGNNTYAVFERDDENKYITSFNIKGKNVDGVEETDGIDITSVPLGEKYPAGMMVVQDGFNYNDTIKQSQNFKIISFSDLSTFLIQ